MRRLMSSLTLIALTVIAVGLFERPLDSQVYALKKLQGLTPEQFEKLVELLDRIDPQHEAIVASHHIVDNLLDLAEAFQVQGPDVFLQGRNLWITNGIPYWEPPNGTGNLILGHNIDFEPVDRSGSHNLVIGNGHAYPNQYEILIP